MEQAALVVGKVDDHVVGLAAASGGSVGADDLTGGVVGEVGDGVVGDGAGNQACVVRRTFLDRHPDELAACVAIVGIQWIIVNPEGRVGGVAAVQATRGVAVFDVTTGKTAGIVVAEGGGDALSRDRRRLGAGADVERAPLEQPVGAHRIDDARASAEGVVFEGGRKVSPAGRGVLGVGVEETVGAVGKCVMEPAVRAVAGRDVGEPALGVIEVNRAAAGDGCGRGGAITMDIVGPGEALAVGGGELGEAGGGAAALHADALDRLPGTRGDVVVVRVAVAVVVEIVAGQARAALDRAVPSLGATFELPGMSAALDRAVPALGLPSSGGPLGLRLPVVVALLAEKRGDQAVAVVIGSIDVAARAPDEAAGGLVFDVRGVDGDAAAAGGAGEAFAGLVAGPEAATRVLADLDVETADRVAGAG